MVPSRNWYLLAADFLFLFCSSHFLCIGQVVHGDSQEHIQQCVCTGVKDNKSLLSYSCIDVQCQWIHIKLYRTYNKNMVLFQMVISVLDMYSPKFSVTFITVIVLLLCNFKVSEIRELGYSCQTPPGWWSRWNKTSPSCPHPRSHGLWSHCTSPHSNLLPSESVNQKPFKLE